MYQSSDCCKGDGNGMALSESKLEGGWLPDQRGVLGLDDDNVVMYFTLTDDTFSN
jgi:hypothetical protein